MPPVVTAIEIGPYGTPGTFGAARPADHVATLRLVDDRFRNWPVLDGGTVTSSNPSVLARHAGDGARSLDRRHGHRQ